MVLQNFGNRIFDNTLQCCQCIFFIYCWQHCPKTILFFILLIFFCDIYVVDIRTIQYWITQKRSYSFFLLFFSIKNTILVRLVLCLIVVKSTNPGNISELFKLLNNEWRTFAPSDRFVVKLYYDLDDMHSIYYLLKCM